MNDTMTLCVLIGVTVWIAANIGSAIAGSVVFVARRLGVVR